MPTDVEVFISAKFFFRYCGNSVIRRWKPQLLPKLEAMIAQKGIEVHMDFQGIGRGSALVAGSPARIYSLSASEIDEWAWGVSAASQSQRASQTKQAPPSEDLVYWFCKEAMAQHLCRKHFPIRPSQLTARIQRIRQWCQPKQCKCKPKRNLNWVIWPPTGNRVNKSQCMHNVYNMNARSSS